MALHIKRVRNLERDQYWDLAAEVVSQDETEEIVFRRHSSVEGLATAEPRPDAFLILLIMHAMKTRQDIWLDQPVDPLLLFNMRGSIQKLLQLCFPELERVKIEADPRDETNVVATSDHVATGFSGGVDSMQLIHRKLRDPCLPSKYCVSMLMHHNVGSVYREEQYRVNCQHTKAFAADFDLAFAGASCNTAKYFSGYSFLETHSLRTSAATLSLSPVYRHYLFASGTELPLGLSSIPTRVLDASNPILLPLLQTQEHTFVSFGAEYTRLEKILEVLSDTALLSRINVCARTTHDNSQFLNCARCFKCVPFLLVADAVGKLKAFEKNFDLATYRRHKSRCMTNFFIAALGPKRSQTNRQVAWFLRKHGSETISTTSRFFMGFVPNPFTDSQVKASVSNLQNQS